MDEMWDEQRAQDEIIGLVAAFAVKCPDSAISVLVGMLAGLLESEIKEKGGDPNIEIRLVGDGWRDITIHAPQSNQ